MILTMLSGITEIIAAVAGISIGCFGVYTYYKDKKRNAQKDTLDAYSILQKDTFNYLNTWSPSEIRNVTEYKQSDDYKKLSGYLADVERFCVGINEGIYDFGTFYELSHGYFDDERRGVMPRLIPLIEAKSGSADEDYFANIHKVWNRMEKKKGIFLWQ